MCCSSLQIILYISLQTSDKMYIYIYNIYTHFVVCVVVDNIVNGYLGNKKIGSVLDYFSPKTYHRTLICITKLYYCT